MLQSKVKCQFGAIGRNVLLLLTKSQVFFCWIETMATSVIINNQPPQPPPQAIIAVQTNQWSTGICGCFDDLQVCESTYKFVSYSGYI